MAMVNNSVSISPAPSHLHGSMNTSDQIAKQQQQQMVSDHLLFLCLIHVFISHKRIPIIHTR